MAHSFQENMTLAMKHEMRVRELVGRTTVLPAHLVVDKTMGKDLMIFSDATGHGVAARVRRWADYDPWDFTIRKQAVNHGASELDKFRSGMCRLMFYGILNREETNFDRWMLISLDAWRRAMDKRDREGGWPLHYDVIRNYDGSVGLVYSAKAKRLMWQPGFMVDCSDYSYEGGVHMRHFLRQQEDARRFRRAV